MIYHVLILLSVAFKITYCFQGFFWHICDIHLNISYNDSHTNSFGNYFSDSPISLVKSAITAMKSIQGQPDFILWNGDNTAHVHMDNVTFQQTIKDVSKELWDQFPTTNILPSLGNHDVNPSNQLAESSDWCEKLLEYWRIFFRNSTTEIQSFRRGCFYSRVVNLSNRTRKVLVLNSVAWYSVNKANKDLLDPYGQFQWMKTELQDSRILNLKVFIVGHVPPGTSEYSPQKYKHLHPQFNKQLVEIFRTYSDVIEAGFFSHEHTDSFRIVYNAIGEPVSSLFLSPSVTPIHLSGLGSVNPSLRLYTWPPDHPSHRLYSQYHTTLPRYANSQPLTWSLEYNSSDYLPSLSPIELHSLLTDFSLDNSLHFNEFFRRHLSGRSHDNNETCAAHSVCRCRLLCGMKHVVYNDLDHCLLPCNSSIIVVVARKPNSIVQMSLIVTVIVVFTLILIASVVAVNKVYCHQRRSASLTRDIFMASYNGKDCEQIVSDHIDHIAAVTFGDVPEYKGHFRDNSRTILTLNDGNDIVDGTKSPPLPISKFALSNKNKSQEKYDYSRM